MMIFDYQRPHSLDEAHELLLRDNAVALAGGTDLMVAVRHHASRPGLVVDLKSVEAIGNVITREDARLVVDGGVVMSRLAQNDVVNERFPALAAAASVVGSLQIRNRATLAGNICNASPAADTAPALLAYSAEVTIAGPEASRKVPLDEFFLGPGSTVVGRGEVVTSIEIPMPAGPVGSTFARVTRRRGVDLASVSLACVVEGSGKARFGFGAVGPTPLVAETTVDEVATDDGLERLLSVTSPISDVRAGADYRHAMLRVHARRAIDSALGQLERGS